MNSYRYGFNGQERETEINPNITTAMFWEYDGRLGRRWNRDPKLTIGISDYATFNNNPIINVDPNGDKSLNFDKNGNYTNTTKDTKWHNFWNGSKGRILDDKGKVMQKFKFADPDNDVADIQSGKINRVQFVSEKDITSMLGKTGVFNAENKMQNRPLSEQTDFLDFNKNGSTVTFGDRYTYFLENSTGGKSFDFSYSTIPNKYEGASFDPLHMNEVGNTPTPMIFLVGKMAHNHMNFGNFLWAASGQALGFKAHELKLGAHFNSKFNSTTNGYESQWDSSDDQRSIAAGFKYGLDRRFDKKQFRVIIEMPKMLKVGE